LRRIDLFRPRETRLPFVSHGGEASCSYRLAAGSGMTRPLKGGQVLKAHVCSLCFWGTLLKSRASARIHRDLEWPVKFPSGDSHGSAPRPRTFGRVLPGVGLRGEKTVVSAAGVHGGRLHWDPVCGDGGRNSCTAEAQTRNTLGRRFTFVAAAACEENFSG